MASGFAALGVEQAYGDRLHVGEHRKVDPSRCSSSHRQGFPLEHGLPLIRQRLTFQIREAYSDRRSLERGLAGDIERGAAVPGRAWRIRRRPIGVGDVVRKIREQR